LNREIRIALMGSASLGKTTTAKMLKKNLGIDLHSELESKLIRKMISSGIITDKSKFTPEQSKYFQNIALKIREKLARSYSFISDRTAGELWVYHQMYCSQNSTSEELDTFKNRAQKIMLRYTHSFLFPFGVIPLVDDRYRNTDSQYQRKVHNLIEIMLKDFNLDYVALENKPLKEQERFEEVMSWIKG